MRLSKVAVFALLILVISTMAFANYLVAVRAPKSMRIDGKLDEWEAARPHAVEISSLDYLVDGNASEWAGPEDLSGKFYFMYDDDYLYVAAEVVDDKLFVDFTDAYLFQSDGIQIFISWDGYGTGRTSYSTDDFQFGFAPGLEGAYPEFWIWNNSFKFSDLQFESSLTEDGYIIEVALPAWEVGAYLDKNSSIAVDVGLTDTDYPSTPQQNYFMYSRFGDGWANVSRFVELVLE